MLHTYEGDDFNPAEMRPRRFFDGRNWEDAFARRTEGSKPGLAQRRGIGRIVLGHAAQSPRQLQWRALRAGIGRAARQLDRLSWPARLVERLSRL
jgi:hypothetical protein